MKKIWKTLLAFLLGFLVFTAIGYYQLGNARGYSDSGMITTQNSGGSYDFTFSNNNYASKKLRVEKSVSSAGESGYMVDQKYQKIATVGISTGDFEEEERKLKQSIKKVDALIQYEKNYGMGKNRRLQMAIGVHPDDFDSLLEELKVFGKLEEFRSDVTDKTNEFRKLQANRESKQAFRNSLTQLKSRSGKIEELINLEDRIMAVEQELQGLGVNLGEFDSENEFSTIKFTMRENVKATPIVKNLFIRKLAKAMEWALLYYGITIFLFSIFFFGSWLFFKVMNELKIVQRTYRMMKDED